MENALEIVITTWELVQEPTYLNSEQTLLNLLKKKGAPVEGELFLKVREDHAVVRISDPVTADLKFLFWKMEPQKSKVQKRLRVDLDNVVLVGLVLMALIYVCGFLVLLLVKL